MAHLLVVPYNDSMQLGQGFNSFLHKPCIYGAVDIPVSSLQTQAVKAGGDGNASQVVSYSSRLVEKTSDVVRSMNISAASSIKSGTIEGPGNWLSLDEAKFAASDLNAVISVKVINQTTTTLKNPKFCPLQGVKMNSQRFFDKFGDCYVSGFMEGGDLHGIASVKVLDATKKSEIEAVLKGYISRGGNGEQFILGEGSGKSAFNAALSQTETTVTVNWSGGGQIKPDGEGWSLDTLLKAASSFPSSVASCPRRTWAILTRYDNNRSFVEWAEKHDISVPHFNCAKQTTSDLLDNFMEYKNNLARLNSVMANPAGFKLSPNKDPIELDAEALINERNLFQEEMNKISCIIDDLNKNPLQTSLINLKNPILWAGRLPVPIDTIIPGTPNISQTNKLTPLDDLPLADDPVADDPVADDPIADDSVADDFVADDPVADDPVADDSVADDSVADDSVADDSIANDPATGGSLPITAPTTPPPEIEVKQAIDSATYNTTDMARDVMENSTIEAALPADIMTDMAKDIKENQGIAVALPADITTRDRAKQMSATDQAWVNNDENKLKYAYFRFDHHVGSSGGGAFNDAIQLKQPIVAPTWPKLIEIEMTPWAGHKIVRNVEVIYDDLRLWHGSEGTVADTLTVCLEVGEKINRIRLGSGQDAGGVEGIAFVEIYTTSGQVCRIGDENSQNVTDYYPFDGTDGFKGWWGNSGDVIDKLAPIWGH